MNDKYIELAKKLKALADKGVGGEKTNAEKMLNDLMKKHGIKIEDIEGEATNDYFFNLQKEDIPLWRQVVGVTNIDIKKYGEFTKKVIKDNRLKGNYLITCTASEFIQIESMLDFYKKLYKEELDIFFSAFCSANDLLVTPKVIKTEQDLTKEEKQRWLRTQEMASKIKSESFRKQLSN